MVDNKNQLSRIFGTSQSLSSSHLDSLPKSLNRRSAKSTFNSWTSASLVDGIGQVWVVTEHLPSIWRTDAGTASYFVGGIGSHDKANFNGQDCVRYSSVIYRLNEILQSPISHKRREYLRFSEELGQSVRDSDSVEVIRLRYREFIEETKKELKKRRIKQFRVSHDELTDDPLFHRSSEFHHIRRQSAYPDLISMIWNGLMINKTTHDIITAKNCSDEYDLLELCEDKGWATSWFNNYQNDLEDAGYE
ncbi:hypothetical protein HWV00_18655 [Moritella sp. 24]|uniref:hypothetical protein n=1 Tax=Moritella sp. 24 TaxID=2746230 RepID=UPI001BA6125C|nr:hypothetical protein [Moritella sp. 24]QUM78070.1 hypothetical protein HWV00_18655 [Moritella sp. 24]